MDKLEYNVPLAVGSITAGGTLGILIPSCIMLVVMGPILGVPIILTIVPIKRFLQDITRLRSITKQKARHHGCSTK